MSRRDVELKDCALPRQLLLLHFYLPSPCSSNSKNPKKKVNPRVSTASLQAAVLPPLHSRCPPALRAQRDLQPQDGRQILSGREGILSGRKVIHRASWDPRTGDGRQAPPWEDFLTNLLLPPQHLTACILELPPLVSMPFYSSVNTQSFTVQVLVLPFLMSLAEAHSSHL